LLSLAGSVPDTGVVIGSQDLRGLLLRQRSVWLESLPTRKRKRTRAPARNVGIAVRTVVTEKVVSNVSLLYVL
jgi:hypothetical protein